MQWSTDRRQRPLSGLDRMEQAMTALYRALLWLIIVAVVVVVSFVVVDRPWGEGHQGEWFYFTIAVMLVVGWVGGQFLWLRRRERRRQSGGQLPWTVRSKCDDGVFSWQFQIGSNADDPRKDSLETAGGFRSTPFDDAPLKQ